jgi:hypothetical protein
MKLSLEQSYHQSGALVTTMHSAMKLPLEQSSHYLVVFVTIIQSQEDSSA